MQGRRVVVHYIAAQENLKISEHVRDEETKQDQARNGHDGLLSYRGFVESRHLQERRISDYGTHE